MPFFFFPTLFVDIFFWHYVRSIHASNPDTTDSTDSTRAVQGACYNQLATTLYTPAARQSGAGSNTTRVR